MERSPKWSSMCRALAEAGAGSQVIIILLLITLLTHGYPWAP